MASKGLSIVAFVLSIVLAPVGLVFGIVALVQITKDEPGHGLALAAVIVGAILTVVGPILLIIAGSLAYFAVLNPSSFAPKACTFTAGLDCTHASYAGFDLNVTLTNRLGSSITVENGTALELSVGGSCSLAGPTTIPDGATRTLVFTNCDQDSRYDVEINYLAAGSSVSEGVSGQVAI